MNKKGFTLIEIMVVLVILVSLTIGGIFGINEIQNKSKDKALKELYTKVETAADVYLSMNEGYAIDLLNGKTDEKCLKLYTLQNESLLSRDLVNPYTNKKLDGDSCVISFLNEKGEIENNYELDNKGKTHRIDIEVVGGTSSETYKYGYTKVTFGVDFEENKEIKSVTCNGGANSSFSDKVVVINKINKDQKCKVVIDYIRWNILVETQGGSAIPSNSQVINGTNHEVKLVPNAGYNLNNLTENDYTCTGHDDYSLNNDILTINNITKDIKCTVNFKDNYYIVKFTANGATISPENTSVKHGSSKEFTITPNTGYTLKGASSTCGSISGNKLTINNVTSNMNCTLNLKLDYFSLVIAKGTGISTIYYKIGDGNYISTTSNVNVKVKYGSTYYYYAVPSTGYTLNKCTESDPCSGIMNEKGKSDALSAVLNKYTLTLRKGTGVNAIYYKVNGVNSYESTTNTSINLDVNYNSTYYYYGASSTGYTMSTCTSSSPCTGTMGASAVSKTLSATLNKYTINVVANNNSYGTVSPTSQIVEHGKYAIITLSPNVGYAYSGVSCTGGATQVSLMQGVKLYIGNISQSQNCTVTYTKKSYKVTLNVTNGSSNVTSVTVQHGNNASFIITPSNGYRLELSGNSCGGTLSGSTYTISNITNAKSCSITLKKNLTLYNQILADNPGRETRTDFSSVFTSTTSGTLYTATEKNVHNTSSTTVYYYAGNTTNNWVKFAGYYWRIIRTNADGSVRMLYSGTSHDTTNGFINSNTAFNTLTDSPKYVGYMYGNSDSTLANARINANSSTIKNVIDNWYRTNLTNYTNYISTTAVYCNDRTLAPRNYYGTTSAIFYFTGYYRIYTNKTPTYDCDNQYDAFSGSNSYAKLTYPIALMTADEIAYAGGAFAVNNASAWYHFNSANEAIVNKMWYLLTPNYANNNNPSVFCVVSAMPWLGQLYNCDGVYREAGVRPVISIKSSVYAITGSGTPNNPYTLSM